MAHKEQSLVLPGVVSGGLAPAATQVSLRSLLRFVYLAVVQQAQKIRWWCVVPVASVVTYIMLGRVLANAANLGQQANIWDALFTMFANQYIVVYLLTPVYVYLVSDLGSDSWLSEAMVVRLGSRRWWWVAKLLTLGMLTAAYVALLLVASLAVASFVLPWAMHWSQYTVQQPVDVYVQPAVLAWSPLDAFGMVLLLLGLGWFCMGMAMLVGGRMLGSARWGLGVGVLLMLSNAIGIHGLVPTVMSLVLPSDHLLFSVHAFGDPASELVELTTSFGYWLGWLVVLIPTGWWLYGRYDFLRRD